jgi:ParB-like chromosome segregation protein Spo0J
VAAAVVPLNSESVPVAKLVGMGAPYNPRRIEPEQLMALRRSLRTFGAVEPVVANRRTGQIVGGHQRVKAAEAEGIETLPVVWVDLDETGERQLNLALNRISGEWDEEKLGALLLELSEAGADIALTGFDDSELQKILADLRCAQRGDPDDVPERPAVPVSKPGDLYVLGKHRLLCGDSTNAANVARLLNDAEPRRRLSTRTRRRWSSG